MVKLQRLCGACEKGRREEAWRGRVERGRGFVEGVRRRVRQEGEGRVEGVKGEEGEGDEGDGEKEEKEKRGGLEGDAEGEGNEDGDDNENNEIETTTTKPKSNSTSPHHALILTTLTSLLHTLTTTHTTSTWHTSTTLPSLPRPPLPRPLPTTFTPAPSPLRHAVLPADILVTETKRWADITFEDYDGDYEASTDPLHPVDTTYPVDMMYLQMGVEREQEEEAEGGEMLGEVVWEDRFEMGGWEWGGEDVDLEGEEEKVGVGLREGGGESGDEDCAAEVAGENEGDELKRSVVDVGEMKASLEVQFDELGLSERLDLEADIDDVVKAFWAVVNEGFGPDYLE